MGEARPQEVNIAAFILLVDAIAGIVTGALWYYWYEDWTAGLGVIIALIAFWLYPQIQNQKEQAWNIVVIFSLIAIFLYATSWNYPGIALSIFTIIYYNLPNVKVHFVES
jgi:hypothetical protein